MVSTHWQHQIHLAQLSRQSSSPHHHARAAATLSRGGTQPSGLTLQDPASLLNGGQNGQSSPSAGSSSLKLSGGRRLERPEGEGLERVQLEKEKDKRQDWAALDLGGQGIRNLNLALFNYNFLDKLYINHNRLTSLPGAVCKLGQLTILDVSGNLLTVLPPEIGLMKNLRMLLIIDNNLQSLPPEMGMLYRLEVLGIEGNPLPDSIKNLMSKEGTRGIIGDLRDNGPVPLPPVPRDWIVLEERESEKDNADEGVFSVVSYNILCDRYTGIYGYTPSWALQWDFRRESIKQEVVSYDADIMCLQEVDLATYEEFLLPNLSQKDYTGFHWPKSRAKTMSEAERKKVDGCAIFYKKSVFKLIDQQPVEFQHVAMNSTLLVPDKDSLKNYPDIFNRVATKDNIATVCFLEHQRTGNRLIAVNAHLDWDPTYGDVKLVQVGLLLGELQVMADKFAKLPMPDDSPMKGQYTSGKKIPMVIGGDFNSTPDSGVYQLLSKGSVDGDHMDVQGYKYGKFTENGVRHPFGLKSSYGNIGELSFTNCTPTFKDAIDYIWYSTNSLTVAGLLGEPDKEYMSKVIGFPNAHFPSDHISLLSQFQFKKMNGA
ncbi:Endonuclease/exonuclease/phosphatase [Lipomyces orientalis]|uniref:Endonuclease/exonuclease/phosphatase n=1 Tax=Lipomyces orientalis TaxID=1233043 RepID=A0ACC3TX08_9ASCO